MRNFLLTGILPSSRGRCGAWSFSRSSSLIASAWMSSPRRTYGTGSGSSGIVETDCSHAFSFLSVGVPARGSFRPCPAADPRLRAPRPCACIPRDRAASPRQRQHREEPPRRPLAATGLGPPRGGPASSPPLPQGSEPRGAPRFVPPAASGRFSQSASGLCVPAAFTFCPPAASGRCSPHGFVPCQPPCPLRALSSVSLLPLSPRSLRLCPSVGSRLCPQASVLCPPRA